MDMATKRKAQLHSVRSSEVDLRAVSWKDVFAKTEGIPQDLQKRVIEADNPPSTLHCFMTGTHEFVMKLITGEHFSQVKAAVEQITTKLETKRSRIESTIPSPSDYAKSIRFKEGICDHRFVSDLHVGLQVQAFGKFIESMKSEEDVDSKYYAVASTLMRKMSEPFGWESDRVEEFKGAIQELFELQSKDGPGFRTDGTVLRENRPIANLELRNEFFGITACPVSQNNAYFIHSQKKQKDRSPMLLISVVGCHYLQVFGAAWNGEKCMCVDPLCSPVSLLFVPRDPNNGVLKLARLLSVIDKTIGDITKYHENPDTDYRGPYWTDGGRLEYKGQLMSSVKWLFKATLDGEQKVVVKFVRGHYGEAVHKCLADHCFAPKLIKCHPLPGGWNAVVMEKLEGYSHTYDMDKVKTSFKEAVQLMHKNNYVHGDLRLQNIRIMNERVCILDFDWADTEHTATYPPELNMDKDCNWHPDVKPGGKILKEHDMYQLNSIS